MPSSTDIAQLFASQQGQFSQQNYFAQTIGVQQMGMGLGGSQFFAPSAMQRPGPMPPPGVVAPPPVFSFGPGNLGAFGPSYGAGNAFAGHVMSGIGGAVAAGGVGLGLASMLAPKSAMGMIGSAIDPVSAFLRAGPAIPLLNAGGTGTLMGGLSAAAGPLALGAVAGMAGHAVMHGAQQQQQIGAQLGQFNFLNAQSRTGMGFTRQDAGAMGSAIRDLAHVPEMLTSVEELTRLLPKLRTMGGMQGVNNITEFARRFKETATTIRDMSKILGTTMEEASQMFAHNKGMGFNTPMGQLQNTLAVQYTSGATGMGLGQTMGLQAQGAAIARQFGGRGRFGAQGVLNMAQKIQAGMESGVFNEEMLTDITGMTGNDAVGAAASTMYQAQLGLTQSPMGQAVLAGLMKKGADGKYVLDEARARRFNAGELGIDEIKGYASALGDDAKLAFKGPQGRALATQAAGRLNMGAFANRLVADKGELAGSRLLDMYTGGQMGDAHIDMLKKLGQGGLGMGMEEFGESRGREMNIQSRTDPRQIWERIKRKIHGGTFGQLESVGGKINTALGQAYDDFIDDLVGRRVVSLTKDGAQAFDRAMRGHDNSDLKELFKNSELSKAAGGGGIGFGSTLGGLSAVLGAMSPGLGTTFAASAALFGGSAGDSFADSELFAAVNRFGSDGNTSGRSSRGIRREAMRRTGLSEGDFDAWQKIAGTGAVGTAGEAARGAYGRAAASAARSHGWDKWGGADADVKNAAISGSVSSVLFNALSKAGVEISGSGDINAVIKSLGGESAAAAKIRAAGGDTDAAAMLEAAAEHKGMLRKAGRGGIADSLDTVQAINAGSARSGEFDAIAGAMSGATLSIYKNTAEAAKKVEAAKRGLASAVGEETAALIKDNPRVRKVLHAAMSDQEVAQAIQSGNLEVLRRVAPGFTDADLKQARSATSNGILSGAGRAALANYVMEDGRSNIAALASKADRLATTLSGISVGGELGESVEALAAATRAFANNPSIDAMEKQRDAGSKVASAFYALKGSAREAAAAKMGALGDKLMGAAGVMDASTMSYQTAVNALGMDEASRVIPGLKTKLESGGSLSSEELARVKQSVTGGIGAALATGGGKEASQGSEQELKETLKNLATNSKLQTDILRIIAKGTPEGTKMLTDLEGNPDNKKTGGAWYNPLSWVGG